MNVQDDEFIIVAVSPNSWGSNTLASMAVKHARLNINWKALPPDQREANISVYICHIATQIDTESGGLMYPEGQKPLLWFPYSKVWDVPGLVPYDLHSFEKE